MVRAWPPRRPPLPTTNRPIPATLPTHRPGRVPACERAASRHRWTSCRRGASSSRSWTRSWTRARPGARHRPGSAARRAEPGSAPRGDPRGRTAPGRRRGWNGQDPGDHPAHRLARRDPTGKAVGDPRPDVHRQGRRGDGGPRRPARAVRVHRYRDLDVPCVRRRPHPTLRAGARIADRPACPDPARGRHLPSRASLRVRPRPLPAPRRSHPIPQCARDAVQPVQGRGHQPGRLSRVRGPRLGGGDRRGRGRRPVQGAGR